MKSLVACLLLCRVSLGAMGDNLCRPVDATDVAAHSGLWQDAGTWTDGTVPVAGERVYIPSGITVANHAVTADVLWIHAGGVLTCCEHCDTQVNVHTIYVPMGGAVRLHSTGRCVVEWLPGPFLPGDSTKLSRGLICHGEFMARGVGKTAWSEIASEQLPAGATSLVLPVAPLNWQAGDRIILTGTDSPRNGPRYQTEFRTITAVSGATVTFDQPLANRHWRWRADLPYWCGNLARNVVFRSREPNTLDHRGHLMVMSDMSDVRYAAIEGCGRTNALQPVTDPRFDAYGEMISGSDANVRARYALHWHRVGPLKRPGICVGCVVDGSPKWGFLIHDSVVHLQDGIAVNCNGSGFATEEGQERGSIDHCLSAMNHGLGDVLKSTDDDHGRAAIGDFGIDGSGFWLQGPGVSLTNSAAVDNSGRGIALFNRTLNGYPVYGPVASWLQYPITVHGTLLPIQYGGAADAPASAVLPQRIERNWCCHNKVGLQAWSGPTHDASGRQVLPAEVRGSVRDLVLWGRGNQLHLEYTRQLHVDGVTIVGDHPWRGQFEASTNAGAPVIVRLPQVSIQRLSIEGVWNRNNWPQPQPIGYVGNAADWPTIAIDGAYPIVNLNTGAVLR